MKKLISLFLTLVLTLTVFGTVAMAETTPAAKIMVEKTKKIFFTAAAVSVDSEAGKKIYTSATETYVNYAYDAIDSGKTSETAVYKYTIGYNDTITSNADITFPYYRYLFLKADLSELKGKEIVSATFTATTRVQKTAADLRAYKTKTSDWTTESITYDTRPDVDTDIGYVTFDNKNTATTETVDCSKFISTGDETLSIRFSLNQSYKYTAEKGAHIYYVGGTKTTSPYITVTYLDEIETSETITDKFTYEAEAEEGTTVRMLVGIYDSTGALLDVKTSDRLVAGTDKLSLPIDLTSYTTVASVKCFLWNADTLEPLMGPVEKTATVTTTATTTE